MGVGFREYTFRSFERRFEERELRRRRLTDKSLEVVAANFY